jgi:hypothetical protein
MAKTLEKYSEGVLNYFRHAISTVCLEGIDNKIKALIRRAYSFRNLGNFMSMVLAIKEFSPAKLMGSGYPARPPYPAASGLGNPLRAAVSLERRGRAANGLNTPARPKTLSRRASEMMLPPSRSTQLPEKPGTRLVRPRSPRVRPHVAGSPWLYAMLLWGRTGRTTPVCTLSRRGACTVKISPAADCPRSGRKVKSGI